MKAYKCTKAFGGILIAILFVLALKTEAEAEVTIDRPEFSVSAGLYTEEFELTLSFSGTNANIYYTLDGSIPVQGSTTTYAYTAPIKIGYQALRETPSSFFCGTVIRAIAIYAEGNTSPVATSSYFVDSDIFNRYKLPIISLTTDKDNLYNREYGIMSSNNTQNRGREWERPVYFEYFDAEGALQLSMNAGMRLHGGASRDWAFKSLRLYARTEYDEQKQFAYDFFGAGFIPAVVKNGEKQGEAIDKFKRLILRSGGNEGTAGDGILFRDALSQALMVNTSLDLQAYTPAIVFLNGEFYGIQNIRERQDEKYIEDHYDVDETEVVIYEFSYDDEGNQSPVIASGEEADLDFYNQFLEFIRTKDLSVQENYEQVTKWLDIENFVDYQIINIYGANRDWPGNNSKAWRVRRDYDPNAEYGLDGRLRWLVYDMDFNFGLYNNRAVNLNSLNDATKAGGREWPTQDGATLLLRKLLVNNEFKQYFCQRFLDLLNTNFDKDYAKDLVDRMAAPYESAIGEFKARYGLLHDWYRNLDTVKEFIEKRDSVSKSHLAAKFKLGKLYFLTINTASAGSEINGSVTVNTISVNSNTNGVKDGVWKKSYYQGLPTTITAVPAEGYEFVSWSGTTDSIEATIDASVLAETNSEVILTPVFREANTQPEAPSTEKPDEASADEDITEPTAQEPKDETSRNKDSNYLYIGIIIILVLIILLLGVYSILYRRKNKQS